MKTIKDNWFIQEDVKRILDSHNSFKGKWTLIYESKESAIEYLSYNSKPIKVNFVSTIIKHTNWADDDIYTKKKI